MDLMFVVRVGQDETLRAVLLPDLEAARAVVPVFGEVG